MPWACRLSPCAHVHARSQLPRLEQSLLAVQLLGRLRVRRDEPLEVRAAQRDPIQATPATGCASWRAGAGDGLPPQWKPVGFVTRYGPTIDGKPLEPLPHQLGELPRRPGPPSEAAEFDRKLEVSSWLLADALLARARLR